MKNFFLVIILFSFVGCLSKKWKLKKDFAKNMELIRNFSESIRSSDEMYAQYSSVGDSLNASKYLRQLVNNIKQRDSVIKINDSLFKELKKYRK